VIWDTFMFRDEFDMLQMRLEAFGVQPELVTNVAVEAPWTHRAIEKPRHLRRAMLNGGAWADVPGLVVLDDDWDPDPHAPWLNEHHQRNRAWAYIDKLARDEDWVLICDVDEIPSQELLSRPPGFVCSVPMRTFLFAVDWEVARRVPPTCVVARVGWLRQEAAAGYLLAEVRDRRDDYPEFDGFGGWHFSWCGGPAAQKEKLETATCHTEILGTEEAGLIRSGARWAAEFAGGGLPVRPVDVDATWPAYIYEERCPDMWFRPRSPLEAASRAQRGVGDQP
jgi:hypothetical protein